jgi:hypothetical protein
MVILLVWIALTIDMGMQNQVKMQNYEGDIVNEKVLFPESSDSGFNYEYDLYGQESAKIGAKIGAKTGAKIGATIGDSSAIPQFPTSSGTPTPEIGQKLIKNSILDFNAENYDIAYDKVSAITTNAGGYVSDSKEAIYTTGNYKRKGGYVIIRIPADKFNSVISQIEAIGNLTAKDIKVQDVTQEYFDLSARLKNTKAEEERFLKIMENATTVEDMLMVEKEIGRVRADIERMQGQMDYMTGKIDWATIQINMQEPSKEEPYKPPEREWGIREAIDNAIDGFLGTTRGLIIIFGYLLPILIVFGLTYFIYKKFKKKEEKVVKKEKGE